MSPERHPAIDAVIGPVADVIMSMAPATEITREGVMDALYHPYMRATLQITVSMLEAAGDMIQDELTGATVEQIAERVRTFIPLGGTPPGE